MLDSLRVLSIEDEEFATELLRIELRRGGFNPTVERVSTREEMSCALDQDVWDVILSDHDLPCFDGFSALSLLKERSIDIPFILVSGVLSDDLAVQAMKAGAHDYIMKRNLKRLVPSIERELREVVVRRKLREEERITAEREIRFQRLVENIQEVFWTTNIQRKKVTYVSPLYETVWGRSCESLYRDPNSWLALVHGEDRERIWNASLTRQLTGDYDEEFRIVRPDGSIRWIRSRAFPVQNEGPEVTHVVGISEDITLRKEAEIALRESEARIKSLAYCDPLTALPNRVRFIQLLKENIQESDSRGKPFSILLIDLDNFKEVNDTLGHPLGDLLLQDVAQRLLTTLRPADTIARIGGDEFGLLLPMASSGHMTFLAEKILKVFEKPFTTKNLPISVEPSIGIALFPGHGRNAETLLQRADIAMYEAKGRRCGYVIYNPESDKHSPKRLALMGALRPAIQDNQLKLFYQPKVDLKTGTITAVEALVRWNHPTRGMIPPGAFIPFAEKTGMILPLTEWVLFKALNHCRGWRESGYRLRVAVNLSARNLHNFRLIRQIENALKDSGLDASMLVLELTESAIMTGDETVTQVLSALKKMGIQLSIDDFGTGYSSLAYLTRLDVDILKIDQSFVKNMATRKDDALIVDTIIKLAHNLGLRVVAEGVEDEATLRQLADFGCDFAQGYFISHPLPLIQFDLWLKNGALKRGWTVQS